MGRVHGISLQHIESQLDRVRHERELWKEVVDKRSQQPLQLALTLKDPHTGQPLPGPGFAAPAALGGAPPPPAFAPVRPLSDGSGGAQGMMQTPPMASTAGMVGPADQAAMASKASPLAKRIGPTAVGRGAPPQGQKA